MATGCKEVDRQLPSAIFDVALPEALKVDPEPARRLGILVEVRLTGDGGGEWTVDLKKPEVRKGGSKRADLRVRSSVADFARLMRMELSPSTAMKDGRLSVEGNVQLLEAFFQLLVGGGKRGR